MALFRNAFLLRAITTNAFIRNCSSSANKLVAVSFNEKNKYATITMQRKPVNGLSLEFFTELYDAIGEAEDLESKGIILTSNCKNVFCAGLDINEMIKPNPERFEKFWTSFQDVWLKLYGSMVPTVAVINGHAPAGGCLLSTCCEYRVMLPNFSIGLNEDHLGVVAPKWVVASMMNVIGPRKTELALTAGQLFKTDKALEIGLIDEIASDYEDGIAKAEKFFASFKKVSMEARGFTKYACRRKDIIDLEENRDEDRDTFYKQITRPEMQMVMQEYLASLKTTKSHQR